MGSLASISVLVLLLANGPINWTANKDQAAVAEESTGHTSLEDALRGIQETDWRPLKLTGAEATTTTAPAGTVEVLGDIGGGVVLTRVNGRLVFTRKLPSPEDRVELELFRITISIPKNSHATMNRNQ